MAAGRDIRIRWVLDVVDRGGASKVLAQDREIRSSLGATDTAYGRVADAAARSSEKQASAARLASTALGRQSEATSRTAAYTTEYVASQREALSVGSRLVVQSDRVAGAYSRQAAAAKGAAREQGRLAKLSAGGLGGVLGGAGSVLAASGKLVGGTALGLLATATGLTLGGLKRGTQIRAGAAGIAGIAGVDPKTATALAVIANAEQVQPRGLAQAFSSLGKQVVGLQQEIAKGKPGKASEGFASLGISPQRVRGLQDNLPALFDLVFQRAQKLPAAQQAATLKTFLGRGAAIGGQIELAGPLSKQIATVREQLGGLDPGKLQKLHETEIRLKEASVGLELSFAQTFGPPLISIFNKLAPAIKPFGEVLKTAITVPLEWIKREAPSILDTFTKGVKGEAPKTQKPTATPSVVLTTQIGGPSGPRLVAPVGPRPPGFGKGHVRSAEPFSETPAPIEKEPSKLEQITRKAGEIAKTIGSEAQKYGKQLLAAFQPAVPFFQNVLLPVLEGTGKGIGAAFTIALPVIRVASEALGGLAKVLGPLGPALKVVGIGLGIAFAGPVLAKLADVKRIGPLFSLLRLPLIVAGGALKGFGVAADLSGKLFAKLPGRLGTVTSGVVGHVGDWARALGDSLQGSPKKLARLADESASSFISSLGSTLGKAKAAGKRWAGAIVEGVSGVTGKVRQIVSNLPLPGRGKGAVETVTKGGEQTARKDGESAAGGFLAGWASRLKGGAALIIRVLPWAAVAAAAGLFVKELVGVFKEGFSAIGKIRFPRFVALEHIVQEIKRLPGQIGGVASSAAGAAAHLASSIAHGISGLPGKLGHVASAAGSAVIHRLSEDVGLAEHAGEHIANSVNHGIESLLGKIAGLGKSLFNGLFNLGYEIVQAIVKGIESTPGKIWDAIKGLGGKAAGAVESVVETLNPFHRKGGIIGYQGGGLVDAFVSPGEAVVYGNSTWTVPGRPTAADSVYAQLPIGAAVLTGDGQRMMSEGASMSEAIARQAPHFRTGGFVSTAYGPPWVGIEGKGETATGINLRNSPHLYIVAVDPSVIPLHSKLKINPNPFSYSGTFSAEDTGGAIKGNRIDFYDWKGRSDQNAWGRRNVSVSTTGKGGPIGKAAGGSETVTQSLTLGRSRTRAGLLSDALQQGIDAGKLGLTGEEIAEANRGRRNARRSPLTGEIAAALGAVTKEVKTASESGKSATGKLPTGVSIPSGTWNPSRKPIDRWIQPYLAYGASHGWPGIVESGFRSRAEQERIYASGVRPAAKPGTSKHEQPNYPGGAVDVSDAAQLASALAKRPGPHLLQWAGARDPVHFSHPVNGKYREGGVIGFRAGGKLQSRFADVTKKLQHLWNFAAPFYGRSKSRMPKPTYTSGNDALFVGVNFGGKRAGHRELFIPNWIAEGEGKTAGLRQNAPELLALILHEWAHEFQRYSALNRADRKAPASLFKRLGTGLSPAAEGGAQAFADTYGPGIISAAGLGSFRPSASVDGLYHPAVRWVRQKLGAGWIGHGQFGFRRGGLVRRFRGGGSVGGDGSLNELAGGLTRLDKTAGTSKFQSALSAFEETLEGLSTKRLNQLVTQLTRAARKGGGAKVVKSFQAAIDAIEGKLGLRIGQLEQSVTDRAAAVGRGQGAVERSLRARGIDPTSQAGLSVQIGFDDKSVAARRRSVAESQRAVQIAKSTHNVAAIKEATEGLTTAQEELDEAVTKGIEDRRALVLQAVLDARQAAQDATDQAQFGVESTQNALTGFDIGQKLNRTAEAPGGLQAKAREIEGKLIPALQSSVSALNSQLGVLEATGASGSELNAVRLQIQSAGNDIGNAMVEAAEDVRTAAETASEELVEKATHRGTLASAGLQKLEIQERLAGTFDSGGVQRANFIKSEIIPALEGERQALQQRQATAEAEGNPKLAEQIADQMAAKNNDILSAQLEVQEQIASNTNPNHKVGGTLGFTEGGESLTDAIISVGSGA